MQLDEGTRKRLLKYRIAYIILNDRIEEKKTPADEKAEEIIDVFEQEFGYTMSIGD